MMTQTQPSFIRLIACAVLLGLLSACSGVQLNLPGSTGGAAPAVPGAQQAAPTSTPIPTAPAVARPTYLVQRGDVADILEVSGRWQPRDQLTLSFPINGTIRTVSVQRNASVRAGTVLADLQITDLENQLASAQVSLTQAIANLNSTGSTIQSVQNAQISLANANLRLEQLKANSPWAQVATAKTNLTSAQAALDKAQRDLDNLLSHQDTPASQVDQARETVRNATVQVQNAQNSYFQAAQSYNSNQLDQKTQQNAIVQAQIALQNAQNGADVDPNKLSSVQTAQLKVDQIKQQIAQSTIKAPIDGEILDITIKPGDAVKAFDTVIIIGRSTPLEVIASIAFGDASALSIGLVGIAQPLNRPDQAVQSIVRRVPLSAKDSDQTTRVAASLTLPSGSLVELKLPKKVSYNVLWLPPVAIRTFQNRTYVVLQTPDGPRTADVTLGLQTKDRDEITQGVKEGDIVVGP